MSGHSKWSTIKHKKGAADAKRGRLFSKIVKELSIAARQGGGDPSGNPRLRTVMDKARLANMPQDNIVRAIKKGTGELEGVHYEETCYEGYGPGGVALLIDCLSDNTKRTVAEVRHLLAKHGGSMGEAGSVAWMFSKKGTLSFSKKEVSEETLMELALEAGAEDIQDLGDLLSVTTEPAAFDQVKGICEKNGLKPLSAELAMVPKNTIRLEGDHAAQMIKLMEILEDHEDVQNVYANFDIDDNLLESLV